MVRSCCRRILFNNSGQNRLTLCSTCMKIPSVYHHECIKEWLLRHTQCCMCKQTYLSVDTKRGRDKKSLAVAELSQQYATAAATSYYCLQNGLIRIPESIRCTRTQLRQMEEHLLSVTVTPSELITLRGKKEDIVRQSPDLEGEQSYNPLHETIVGSTSTDELTAPMDLTASFESEMEGIETSAININYELVDRTLEVDLECNASIPSFREQEQWVHWDQELVSVADYLERTQMLPDNRCCIKETNEIDGGIEVEVTTGRSCHEENDSSEGSG
jgi:hypothetical protein